MITGLRVRPEDFYRPYPKTPRLHGEIIITEKIDGTNACVIVTDDFQVFAGSKNRILSTTSDNFGFAQWVQDNQEELKQLGPGSHAGEWWGQGIQRTYGMTTKKFSLFNVSRWSNPDERPECCGCVPVLATRDTFDVSAVDWWAEALSHTGSYAAPGFMNPEGVVVYHVRSGQVFKAFCPGNKE